MKVLKFTLFLTVLALFAACKNAPEGDKAETSEAAPAAETTAAAKVYNVATGPVLNWKGSKIGGDHMGTIDASSGTVSVEGGKVTGGTVVFDMASLNTTDLEGDGKAKLDGHLKSPDFFDVATYPTSKFQITKVTELLNNEGVNAMVYGNLTLKDVTKQVGFKAQINVSGSDVSVKAPDFTIDRTDFNMKYGSSKFFDGLKDKAINDEVGLRISLRAS